MTNGHSQYESIALDLADMIGQGRLQEGARFSCRKLAERYQVSAETVRRAAGLLAEEGIVQLEAGSGVLVTSRPLASAYRRRADAQEAMQRIQSELFLLMDQRQHLDQAIARAIRRLLEEVGRLDQSTASD
ncbi:MAG: GntR family transcriptional regulator [Bacillota bacterium]